MKPVYKDPNLDRSAFRMGSQRTRVARCLQLNNAKFYFKKGKMFGFIKKNFYGFLKNGQLLKKFYKVSRTTD